MANTPKKPLTKTQLIANLADETGLTKQQVGSVLDGLTGQIRKSIGRNGPGALTLPGLLKIVKVKKPAVPAAKNIPNPFKPGETYDRKAKPATSVVKIRPLKNLKEMV